MVSDNLLKPLRKNGCEPWELESILAQIPLPFFSLPSNPLDHYLRILKVFFSGVESTEQISWVKPMLPSLTEIQVRVYFISFYDS